MEKDARLQLPDIVLSFSPEQATPEILLVAGGRPPDIGWLRRVASGRVLWCADRGVDVCRAAGLVPDRLIGDADSAAAEVWRWAETNGTVCEKFPPEKDFTDTELALQRIKTERPTAFILLVGAFGGRLDHAFSTLYSLAGSGLSGLLADESELLLIVHGGESVCGEVRQTPLALSLLPLSAQCSGVTLTGVRWPLTDAGLTQREPNAVSNILIPEEQRFSLSLGSGCLALYLCWHAPNP